MSTSVSTETYIGIPVTYEDFVTTVQLNERGCPVHGTAEAAYAPQYCPKCGKATVREQMRTPTKHLLALSERVDIAPKKFMMEGTSLRSVGDAGFMIHVADKSWYEDPKHFLLGLRVTDIVSVTDDPLDTESILIPEVMAIYEKVRALVVACGFDAEEIRLFHTGSVG